jgi:hypothetical protein
MGGTRSMYYREKGNAYKSENSEVKRALRSVSRWVIYI